MEFTITQRGACSLVFQGYKYVINRRGRDGRIFNSGGAQRAEAVVVGRLQWRIKLFQQVATGSAFQQRLSRDQMIAELKIYIQLSFY